ncbi:hypothetical protein [uncultured Bartonella sp.]|uniref:hypothetical protein n=1 Tax=uncultured Bartonella sp. TaxID=104108 RepID=UPI0025E8EA7A|nr:hypothetical protein [uncultured Bartonella sp.]
MKTFFGEVPEPVFKKIALEKGEFLKMQAGFFKKQEVIFQEPVFANSVSMMRQ